jgi:predicted metalloprotease
MSVAPGAVESGVPPPDQRLRAIVVNAWEDSLATWKRIGPRDMIEMEGISLRFVGKLAPQNCYGLYAGEGPAYCSGNQTVFVGTGEATRLLTMFGPQGEAGIAFLIGHEIGHHVQNVRGRFDALNVLIARHPGRRAELMRRFELESDCFAGVWMHASELWSGLGRQGRAGVLAALLEIGDDRVLLAGGSQARFAVHGTSGQRTRWFLRGANGGDIQACDTFAALYP